MALINRESTETYHVHGMTHTPEYQNWLAMKNRVKNKSHINFEKYGGSGIIVCDRWLHSFENFYADVGNRPTPKHSIDRIDNDGNYEPNNCRWADNTLQNYNKGIRSSNKSGHTGVTFHNRDELWLARFKYKGQILLSKYFKNKDDAIDARLNAELKYKNLLNGDE